MDDALLPLRCAYGVEAPGARARPEAPASGTPGASEAALLSQMRDALDRWPRPAPDAAALDAVREAAVTATATSRAVAAHVAALDAHAAALPRPPALRPAADVVAAVQARAADVTLAALRATYGEPVADGVTPRAAEALLLAQGRDVLERAPHAAGPSEAALAAIVQRAEDATAVRADVRDDAVSAPALASLAAVYGLATPHPADPVEATLLAGSRDALLLVPPSRPDARVWAAVTAQAAEASSRVPAARPAADRAARPADRAARPADRAAAAPRRTARRSGVWIGSAALLGVLALAVLRLPATDGVAPAASDLAAATTTAETAAATPSASDAGAAATPPESIETPSAGALEGPLAAASPRADGTPRGPSALAEEPRAAAPAAAPAASVAPPVDASRTPAPVARRAAPRLQNDVASLAERVAAVPPPPSPSSVRARTPRPSASVSVETAALVPVAARTAAPSPDAAWDASGDLRTIALRVRALRQTTSGADWEAPAEAFGAPRAPVTMSAMPGLQSVRAGAVPARARLRADSTRTAP